MKYFSDIILLEGVDDVPSTVLMRNVYRELHCSLYDLQKKHGNQPVAVAFPNYGKTLGNEIRLFCNDESVLGEVVQDIKLRIKTSKLPALPALVRPVAKVPSKVEGRVLVYRRQLFRTETDNGVKRERVNKEKRHTPYVFFQSGSSKRGLELFIVQETMTEKPKNIAKSFSTYGLGSKTNTVPLPVF